MHYRTDLRHPAIEESPEKRLGMTREQALAMFRPLPESWSAYATAPDGEVASRVLGLGRIMRAALLLYELGEVSLAQRRVDGGTEYLIRRRKNQLDRGATRA